LFGCVDAEVADLVRRAVHRRALKEMGPRELLDSNGIAIIAWHKERDLALYDGSGVLLAVVPNGWRAVHGNNGTFEIVEGRGTAFTVTTGWASLNWTSAQVTSGAFQVDGRCDHLDLVAPDGTVLGTVKRGDTSTRVVVDSDGRECAFEWRVQESRTPTRRFDLARIITFERGASQRQRALWLAWQLCETIQESRDSVFG